MVNVLERVHKLLTLATGSAGGEEARTAAMQAARLIVQHGLIVAEAPPRSNDELRPIVEQLLDVLLDVAWRERENESLVAVADIVDHAISSGDLQMNERTRAMTMLSNLAARERKRGVLVGYPGRNGGYHIATNVRLVDELRRLRGDAGARAEAHSQQGAPGLLDPVSVRGA
jgi:hypothetical protein